MNDGAELNTKNLDKLIRTFREKIPMAKVGILGNKNARTQTQNTNAAIGMKHEFGVGVPMRSFLRAPIIENMQKYINASQLFDKGALAKVIAEGSVREWIAKIGVLGEQIVQEAFASNGFGKWVPWAPGYENKTGQILVDTTQLRDSITSEVK